MEEIGAWLTDLGLIILPYSFAIYFPVRWLEYLWDKGYTRAVKAAWYLALGMSYLTGGIEADVIVTYICFIEACDLGFQQLEVQKTRRQLELGAHVELEKLEVDEPEKVRGR